jgi:hypothetical protein
MPQAHSGAIGEREVLKRHDQGGLPGEAKIRYKDGDYQVIMGGHFVRCAVTGTSIPVDDIKYWSVERQEPYVDAAASLKAHQMAAHRS